MIEDLLELEIPAANKTEQEKALDLDDLLNLEIPVQQAPPQQE